MVVTVQLFSAKINGMPVDRIADDFLPHIFAKVGPEHYSMGHCHKNTSALLAKEPLFTSFLSIEDSLSAIAIGTTRNPLNIFQCKKHVYCIKQCIDCISGELFNAHGKFLEFGHSSNPPLL